MSGGCFVLFVFAVALALLKFGVIGAFAAKAEEPAVKLARIKIIDAFF
jgi:hypothetical protein